MYMKSELVFTETSSVLSSFEGMNFLKKPLEKSQKDSIIKIVFEKSSLVIMARRSHPFPYRTRKLSFSAPMVVGTRVPVRVGRCQAHVKDNLKRLSFCLREYIFGVNCSDNCARERGKETGQVTIIINCDHEG